MLVGCQGASKEQGAGDFELHSYYSIFTLYSSKGWHKEFQPFSKGRSALQTASTRVQELSIRYMRPLGTSLGHMCSYGTHV